MYPYVLKHTFATGLPGYIYPIMYSVMMLSPGVWKHDGFINNNHIALSAVVRYCTGKCTSQREMLMIYYVSTSHVLFMYYEPQLAQLM